MVKTIQSVETLIDEQRQYFYTGQTKQISFRKQQLITLKNTVLKYEKEISQALYDDLHKSEFEAYATEIGLVLESLGFMIKNIDNWAKPVPAKTPIQFQPGKSFIVRDPYGVVCIIAPFNYPFQLVMEPLMGAIVGGNTAIIKPSEYSVHTTAIIKKIIDEIFPSHYVQVVEGEKELVQELIHAPFDYIFFTGSVEVGKLVMRAASDRLTPISLELGGKSPVIIDRTANLDVAAKRLVWGKFTNTGQSCTAPDYVYVHEQVYDEFLQKVTSTLKDFFGEDAAQSPDFGRIINVRHFDRIASILEQDASKITVGGTLNREELSIEPTILEHISWQDAVMQDELFAPILPLLKYSQLPEAIEAIRKIPKPLATYLFSEDNQTVDYFLAELHFGGGCINDTMTHVGNVHLPFGGIGHSGLNVYHGKASFESFTHPKSILKRSSKLASNLSFPPYKQKVKLVRKIIK
ncbi:aldehyde dehydrogenase [Metabacillus fastidiosus]|uniref:aldehyde dehydrogenase n=1 Tax=Metabacillus fastidiosus TaxID=1458 RepID=UPI003D28DE39